MENTNNTSITVETTVNADVSKVWKYWSDPEHIKQWANASDDWHAPFASNDLRKDGRFKTTFRTFYKGSVDISDEQAQIVIAYGIVTKAMRPL